jgi:vacuolar-type H+-ATPase subunit E/Vma4
MTAVNGKLDAVRQAELVLATEEADAIRRSGDERAEQIVARARADAAALIAQRGAAAERLAGLEERERGAEAQAHARASVLGAQRFVSCEVRAAAHAAVRDLAGDPRLERLFERLAADARERLAAAGSVQFVEAADGGFVARAGSREIDYSWRAQVDRITRATSVANPRHAARAASGSSAATTSTPARPNPRTRSRSPMATIWLMRRESRLADQDHRDDQPVDRDPLGEPYDD